MTRKPGPLTGAIELLSPIQARRKRAFRVMGLKFEPEVPKPLPPTFPIDDVGSAHYQMQRARAALLYGWIDAGTFAEVEAIARPFILGTSIQKTVDDMKLRHDPHLVAPHEFELKPRKPKPS
jgi:hypothetical protein